MFKVSLGWIASRLFFLLKLSQKQKLAVEKAEGEDVQDPGKIRKLVGEREKERERCHSLLSQWIFVIWSY